MSLSRTQIVNWLTRCGDIFSTESEYLTGLDREIGDADHGLNMNRGFSKVVEKLPAIADKDIGFILKNTGMTLLSSVGGASGPLFGTFCIRAAQATQLPVESPNPLHKVRLRCKPAKAAPVISVNAVLVTRIPARPR